jgi:hypothetical protein
LGYLEATAKAKADFYGMTNKRDTATATAEADPYGMTNKKGKDNGKSKRRSFDCVVR